MAPRGRTGTDGANHAGAATLPGDDARGDGVTPAARLDAYRKALRRRWPFVAVITLLAAVAGGAVSARGEKEYEATAQILLEQQSTVDAVLGTARSSDDP